MRKEIVLFKSEERKDLASVVAFLHQLADKLATNQASCSRAQRKSLWISLTMSSSS
jgi:hypothetical protein